MKKVDTKALFFVGLIISASGFISPPIALTAGIVYGLTFIHPYHGDSRKLASFLLKASVVGLGFGMNIGEVVRVGRSGFFYTALSIGFSLALGLAIGKLLQVRNNSSFLITTGTAICGGSAIAAVAPILQAGDNDIAVAMGTVFILNSIALLIFPLIGWRLHLSQTQFGLWAALAIHDTSSVVGAAARYGSLALVIGTTVKLARALWIIPVALGVAALKKSHSKVKLPWFILLFCLAAVANSYLPGFSNIAKSLSELGKLGLTATLFLIGTGLSRKTIKEVGVRPLLQGVILWLIVGTSSLLLIRSGIIAFTR
jgi:uncharacterized integral membrane protein (TIGR00698 family)